MGTEDSVLGSRAQLWRASLRVSASLRTPFPSMQNIPTLGSVAVTMALHGCDEVAVAGFGYDMSTPNAPLHYYETVRMAAIKEVQGWAGGSPWAGRGRGKRQQEGQPPTACVQTNGQGTCQLRVWLLRAPWKASIPARRPLPTKRPSPWTSPPWPSPCPGPAPASSLLLPSHHVPILEQAHSPPLCFDSPLPSEDLLTPSNNPQTIPLRARMPPYLLHPSPWPSTKAF